MLVSQVVAVAPVLPPYRYPQQEITDALAGVVLPDGSDRRLLDRVHGSAGVTHRNLALPLDAYAGLRGFGAANDAFIEVGCELGGRAVKEALADAGLRPDDVDLIVTTSVTGIAAPSLDARLIPVLGLRSDIRRVPMFGLGCMAGAAGLARLQTYCAATRTGSRCCSPSSCARSPSSATTPPSPTSWPAACSVTVPRPW